METADSNAGPPSEGIDPTPIETATNTVDTCGERETSVTTTETSEEVGKVDADDVVDSGTDKPCGQNHKAVHLTMTGFLTGNLDEVPSPSDSTLLRMSDDSENDSVTGSSEGGSVVTEENGTVDGVLLQAMAQAKAAREHFTRNVREERRRMKVAAKRDSDIAQDMLTWRRVILPRWREVSNSKLVLKLCLRGIPPAVRGEAWVAMLGNPGNITAELYRIHLSQAEELLASLKATRVTAANMFSPEMLDRAPKEHGREHSLALIDVDIPRTFAHLSFFSLDGPLYEPLRHILQAYVFARLDVGYVQGMSYLAAMILLFIPDELIAFQCFASLMSRHICFDLFRLDREQLMAHLRVFDKLLAITLPPLFQHFTKLGLRSDMFLVEWLLTLFTRVLPLDVAARVWDAFFVLDEVFLMQTALGLLKSLQSELLQGDFADCMGLLKQVPSDTDSDTLFQGLCSVEISKKQYYELVDFEKALAKAGKTSGVGGAGGGSGNGLASRVTTPKRSSTATSKLTSMLAKLKF